METLTKKIVAKIQDSLRTEFMPFAVELRSQGVSDGDIVAAMRKFYDNKKMQLIKKTDYSVDFVGIVQNKKPDSKIEGRFLYLLEQAGIKLRFHYKIGPYTADYLIDDFLVLELDGPTHFTENGKKHDSVRDKFIESFGYKILHIPVKMLMVAHEAVIDEINLIVEHNRTSRKNIRKKKAA